MNYQALFTLESQLFVQQFWQQLLNILYTLRINTFGWTDLGYNWFMLKYQPAGISKRYFSSDVFIDKMGHIWLNYLILMLHVFIAFQTWESLTKLYSSISKQKYLLLVMTFLIFTYSNIFFNLFVCFFTK